MQFRIQCPILRIPDKWEVNCNSRWGDNCFHARVLIIEYFLTTKHSYLQKPYLWHLVSHMHAILFSKITKFHHMNPHMCSKMIQWFITRFRIEFRAGFLTSYQQNLLIADGFIQIQIRDRQIEYNHIFILWDTELSKIKVIWVTKLKETLEPSTIMINSVKKIC